MNERIAFVFPGQGSQYSGMGRELYELSERARQVYRIASEVMGYDLARACFEGSDEFLQQTINTQPAIMATSLAALEATLERIPSLSPAAVAGHSLGEYSALVACGALSLEDALRMVRWRAEYMQEAGTREPGTMAAVMGVSTDDLESIAEEVSASHFVAVSIHNSPTQLVLSGTHEGVKKASELAGSRYGAKVIPLAVSGAFHTRLMKYASEKLMAHLDDVTWKTPRCPIYLNALGRPTQDTAVIRDAIIKQISNPILWSTIVTNAAADGIRTFIEFGPKNVLKGLIKKTERSLVVFNVEDAKTLGETQTALSRPLSQSAAS